MNAEDHSFYFTAFLFSEALQQNVEAIKNPLSEITGSKHSLGIVPHVTLISPVQWSVEEINRKKALLAEALVRMQPFSIRLDGFSSFRRDVLFIRTIVPQEIIEWQRELEHLIRSHFPDKFHHPQREWHPHVTLAFKDLSPEGFDRGMQWLKDRQFVVEETLNGITELIHKGSWKPDQDFSFEK
jgi:2'-5' RNA ligase